MYVYVYVFEWHYLMDYNFFVSLMSHIVFLKPNPELFFNES